MELSQKLLREVLSLSNTYNYWEPGPERGRYLPKAAQVAQRGSQGPSQAGRLRRLRLSSTPECWPPGAPGKVHR